MNHDEFIVTSISTDVVTLKNMGNMSGTKTQWNKHSDDIPRVKMKLNEHDFLEQIHFFKLICKFCNT